jgi:16S rRNA C1402 (ribose-2'-O) methylase RsmI
VLTARPAVKGEITVLIAKAQARISLESSIEDDVAKQVAAGLSRMEAIKCVARRRGLSKREVYRLVQRGACGGSAGR